ncbi:hypothetical protein SSIG_08030 [Streptomyces filamentosus NRRL 11379]|nr:hypothetical protein SSIG_08030 [Streptomyces filamentosus NRRL 11379]
MRYRRAMMLPASAGGNRAPDRPAGTGRRGHGEGCDPPVRPDSSKDSEDTREHPYDAPRSAEPSAARRQSR